MQAEQNTTVKGHNRYIHETGHMMGLYKHRIRQKNAKPEKVFEKSFGNEDGNQFSILGAEYDFRYIKIPDVIINSQKTNKGGKFIAPKLPCDGIFTNREGKSIYVEFKSDYSPLKSHQKEFLTAMYNYNKRALVLRHMTPGCLKSCVECYRVHTPLGDRIFESEDKLDLIKFLVSY